MMKSLLDGVAYIHEKSILHRDLKPENILLTNTSSSCTNVKIVDFGLSAVFFLERSKNDNLKAGTLVYMAPEQATKQSYSKKLDIWACGIIMYQLMSRGKHPYYTKGEQLDSVLRKLDQIETTPIEWKFGDRFSPLA